MVVAAFKKENFKQTRKKFKLQKSKWAFQARIKRPYDEEAVLTAWPWGGVSLPYKKVLTEKKAVSKRGIRFVETLKVNLQ